MVRTSVCCLAVSCVVAFSGCLLNYSHHSVVRQDEVLQPLTFESEQAKLSFEERVDAAMDSDRTQSERSFGIPFLIGVNRSSDLSEAAIRNDTATRLDVNGDRFISEYEASLDR